MLSIRRYPIRLLAVVTVTAVAATGCLIEGLTFNSTGSGEVTISMSPYSAEGNTYTATYLSPDIDTTIGTGGPVSITYNGIEDYKVLAGAFAPLVPFQFWSPHSTPFLGLDQTDNVILSPQYYHAQGSYDLNVHPASCQLASGGACEIVFPPLSYIYEFETVDGLAGSTPPPGISRRTFHLNLKLADVTSQLP